MSSEPKAKVLKCTDGKSVTSSQGNVNFTVNYNVQPKEKIGLINVYPIINIPNSLKPGTPVIINVNVNMPK